MGDSAKVTVSPKKYPGLNNPNPRGEWYYSGANVELANDGALVVCWQLSDNYTSQISHNFVAHSLDGGKTLRDYQSIAPANVWEDISVWVVPQMSLLQDGRLMIIAVLGQRGPGQDSLMLSAWQKAGRGMSNSDFWCSDQGKTWSKGEKIDNVGRKPDYLFELTDGSLAFTRTSASVIDQLRNPLESNDDRVEDFAYLKVEAAYVDPCSISVGVWIRLNSERVSLGDRPEKDFAIDAREWHSYRIVREKGVLSIQDDDVEELWTAVNDLCVREVRFGDHKVRKGSKDCTENAGVSHWKSVSAKVANDVWVYSINWHWTPAQGYPDQFRRDRSVLLDPAHPGVCLYGTWTQLPDGRIVIVDYKNGGSLESYSWGKKCEGAAPFIRAYLVTEPDLVGASSQ